MTFGPLDPARWRVAAPVALSLVLIGSVAGHDVDRAGAAEPAGAYYLAGDSANNGNTTTTFNSTSTGEAWSFSSSGSSATTLVGRCPNGTACWGVQGLGTSIGVIGTASNPGAGGSSSAGVQGSGGPTAANGTSYGGYFSASNSASGGKAYGVFASGATFGVYATSTGSGVRATSTSASGNGVYATGSGTSFYGVWGDVGGGGFGLVGSSNGGTGAYGSSTGSTTGSGDVAGVYGYNALATVANPASARNSGVFGTCTNCSGVYGRSANYVGVYGNATGGGGSYAGFFVAAQGTGVYARTTSGKVAFRAVNANKTSGYYAGVFDGNVRINGTYYATGTSAVVRTSEGDRLMYAEEATQNHFSDQGTARLKRGRAVVRIDRLFAQTVDLRQPYMVIVTPQSFDTTGLGVGDLTARSFEVRELGGGTGTFTFSWRITAVRKGYAGVRMASAPADARITSADGRGALPTRPTATDVATAPPPIRKQPPRAGRHPDPARQKDARS